MPYRATCPACGIRLPRSGYFKPFHQCPACRTLIRPEPTWNQTGNLVCGGLLTLIVICGAFLGTMLGLRGWLIAAAAFFAFLTLCWVLWPYITPYEAVLPAHGFPVQPPHDPAHPLPPPLPHPPSSPVLVPPTPRHHLKTLVGFVLTILGAILWARNFSAGLHPARTKSPPPASSPTPTTQVVR